MLWALSLSCVVDSETHSRWKKLTTWWPGSQDRSCHNAKRWTQGDENNSPCNRRLTVLKTIKMTMIRVPHDQIQDNCQSWLCYSAHAPSATLPIHPWNSSLKALFLWSAERSWLLDLSLPSPQVTSLLNKATFPFLPTPELAFEQLSLIKFSPIEYQCNFQAFVYLQSSFNHTHKSDAMPCNSCSQTWMPLDSTCSQVQEPLLQKILDKKRWENRSLNGCMEQNLLPNRNIHPEELRDINLNLIYPHEYREGDA